MMTCLRCKYTTEEQCSFCVFSFGGGAKGPNTTDINKEMHPVFTVESVLSCKTIHNLVEKLSEGR
jgi:hypothetical protein